MPQITYVEPDGTEHVLDVSAGRTVMEAGRDAGVRGIVAECGGACACATCHVLVPENWRRKLPPIEEMEDDMLELLENRDAGRSRLSCQLRVTDDYDGLVVSVSEG
jgi:2Fe-2S ferredoxin